MVVCCPLQSVPYLISEFHSNNQTITQRMEILDILIAAAAELANAEYVDNTDAKSASANSISHAILSDSSTLLSASSNISSVSSVYSDRVVSRTRRWGTAKQSKPKQLINQFAQYAGSFFFPLVRGMSVKRQDRMHCEYC